MEDNYGQLQRFFTACDELMRGSYLQAEPRIAEVLRSIAACPALYELFKAVSDGYDYPAAKSAYLRAPKTGGGIVALLPSERSEILAYVFCLLVELDSGAMRVNDLLLRYFNTDGSYTGSYAVFTERVIRPFRDIVRNCFPRASQGGGEAAVRRKKREDTFGELCERLASERARVASLSLPAEDLAGGDALLAAAGAAASRQDGNELSVLLKGYRYFLLYTRAESASSAELFRLAAAL